MRKVIKSLIFLVVMSVSISSVPILKADALWNPPQTPTCNAVYLINADTNTVVYEKHEDQKVYPASITKLMTAVLVYEKYKDKLNTKVTVEKSDINTLDPYASKVPLKAGEQLTVDQLMNCMLVKSGDDSANVLARFTGGSIKNFVAQMNRKAKEIGLSYTHYENPHGLQDKNHYTTARDVYKLAKYAMKYEYLRKIVAQPSYTLAKTNIVGEERELYSTNFLLRLSQQKYYYQYVKGIKTGSTTPAGKCLVSYAEKDGTTYYCVAMGGTSRNGVNTAFAETKSLYKWVFGNFDIQPIVKTTDAAAQVKVKLALDKTKLLLKPQTQLNALVPDTFKSSDAKITLNIPDSVKAPIKKGQVIGSETVTLTDSKTKKVQKLGTVKLIASESAELSKPLYVVSVISKFFNSVWFKIVAVILVLLLILYILLSIRYNRRKKMLNRRRMKKYYKRRK